MPHEGGGRNYLDFTKGNGELHHFQSAVVDVAVDVCFPVVDELIPLQGGGKIKSATKARQSAFPFRLRVLQDAGPVPVGLASVALCLGAVPVLDVISLPLNGRVWTVSENEPLEMGDVVPVSDLASLQFLPLKNVSGSASALVLRAVGNDGDALVITVTIVVEASASGTADARRKHVPAVDVDPLAFGLLAALTASLGSAPAAGMPARSADTGGSGDSSDNQARAGLASKVDDASEDPAAEGPSVTGTVQRNETRGAQNDGAHRRLVGSGTPPPVWFGGESLNDKSAFRQLDQLSVQTRPPFSMPKDETPAPFGSVGLLDLRPLGVTLRQVVRDSSILNPSIPPGSIRTTPGPVARDDSGFLVLNGKKSFQAVALLTNDAVSPGLNLSLDGVLAPQHGTVTYDTSTREIMFVATAGYRGAASFSYLVNDGEGRSAQATVTLFVAPDETLFTMGTRPTMDRVNDQNPVELGVRFVSASDGLITGLRFYKGTDNVGVHTANLWDSSGALLTTATFNGETGSGWQQVGFANPVAIRAGITYIASYHTDGLYSVDPGYFASPVTNGDLTAIGSVYAYGSSSSFPINSYNANNYWVDVVYSKPPAAPNAFDDNAGVVSNTGLTSIASSLLLANDQSPEGLPLSITGVGNSVNGAVAYDDTTHAITFTPASGYSGVAGFSYTVSDTFGMSTTADVTLWVAGSQPSTLFGAGAVPTVVKANDSNPVELGFKFQSTVDGDAVGLRFFKGPDNTGPHVGNLWSATGDLLATATFTNETADGWQQVLFSTPVSLMSGVAYVASYHTNGNYSADPGYFASSHTNGLLIAPASTSGNANGVYAYGSSSLFPTDSYNATSYGVDVLFKANLTG